MADKGDRAHEQWGTYLTLFVKCQKIKHLDYGGGAQKKINWHNEVHTYWRQFWRHIWWSLKTLKMPIEIIFGQFCWPSYLTSKLMSISVNFIMSIYYFFVNLLHSPNVWPFDISHLLNLDTYNLNHLSPHRAIFWNVQHSDETLWRWKKFLLSLAFHTSKNCLWGKWFEEDIRVLFLLKVMKTYENIMKSLLRTFSN